MQIKTHMKCSKAQRALAHVLQVRNIALCILSIFQLPLNSVIHTVDPVHINVPLLLMQCMALCLPMHMHTFVHIPSTMHRYMYM